MCVNWEYRWDGNGRFIYYKCVESIDPQPKCIK